MAIVNCPQCGERMSDKAKQCPSCLAGADMDSVERERLIRSNHNQKIQQLSNQSLMAVLVFLIGFSVMYFKAPEQGSVEMWVIQGVMAFGFVWYLINRVRHFMHKHLKK